LHGQSNEVLEVPNWGLLLPVSKLGEDFVENLSAPECFPLFHGLILKRPNLFRQFPLNNLAKRVAKLQIQGVKSARLSKVTSGFEASNTHARALSSCLPEAAFTRLRATLCQCLKPTFEG
jgi:hypothetical protein